MEKQEFLNSLNLNRFTINIFRSYYEEHNTREEILWDEQHFHMFIANSVMFGVTTNTILHNKLIPYYKVKFEIIELKDKQGNLIKIVDEQITEKD